MTANQPTLAQQTKAFGIILFTQNFEACTKFYRDLLGLEVWFEKPGLICLHYGEGYLMVETDGVAQDGHKTPAQNPTILRFNVDDVAAMAAQLQSVGIDVEIKSFDWGTIGLFSDPDGNLCELKDATDPFFQRT